jgi:DNA-binding response OmpR family regulator
MPSRILIADDTLVVREFLEMVFSRHGFEVILAPNGEEALRLALAETPDLMLIDVMMPGIDGLEVSRRVRLDKSIARTPLILYSAVAGVEVREKAVRAGADEFLDKTIHHADLVDRVRDWLATRSAPGGIGVRAQVKVALDIMSLLQTDWVWLLAAREDRLETLAVASVSGEQEAARFLERVGGSVLRNQSAGPMGRVLTLRQPRHEWAVADLRTIALGKSLADAAIALGTRAVDMLPLTGPTGESGLLVFASPSTLQAAEGAAQQLRAAQGYASTALGLPSGRTNPRQSVA